MRLSVQGLKVSFFYHRHFLQIILLPAHKDIQIFPIKLLLTNNALVKDNKVNADKMMSPDLDFLKIIVGLACKQSGNWSMQGP